MTASVPDGAPAATSRAAANVSACEPYHFLAEEAHGRDVEVEVVGIAPAAFGEGLGELVLLPPSVGGSGELVEDLGFRMVEQ